MFSARQKGVPPHILTFERVKLEGSDKMEVRSPKNLENFASECKMALQSLRTGKCK